MSLKATDESRCTASTARTLARLSKQVEMALTSVDLSLPQYRSLVFLSEVDAAMASALAQRLDVSRPTVTALIDGLVARGLVVRQPSEGDRRRVEHRLTPDGEDALRAADDAVEQRLDRIVAHLDDRRADRAVKAMDLWADALTRTRAAYIAGAIPDAEAGPGATP